MNYAIGSKIEISKVGHMLIDALNENPVNEQKIQNVFLVHERGINLNERQNIKKINRCFMRSNNVCVCCGTNRSN